jgi:hypothetical protein
MAGARLTECESPAKFGISTIEKEFRDPDADPTNRRVIDGAARWAAPTPSP